MNFLAEFDKFKTKENVSLLGMTDEFFCLYISRLAEFNNQDIIIVTSTLFEANKLVNSLNLYNDNVLLFLFSKYLSLSRVN